MRTTAYGCKILNHLLQHCGQSHAILAVPNGFAAKVRYDLRADAEPQPGTLPYLHAMRPAIQAIRDGQRYYASLCKPASSRLADIAPNCWL